MNSSCCPGEIIHLSSWLTYHCPATCLGVGASNLRSICYEKVGGLVFFKYAYEAITGIDEMKVVMACEGVRILGSCVNLITM